MAKNLPVKIVKGKKFKKQEDITAPPATHLPTDKTTLRREIRKEIYRRTKQKW
jgi:hypothetical protein